MEEGKDSFILDFMKLCENTEIPGTYAAWSAIGGISCVLARRVWMDAGPYTVFPNMYVCLVGTSGSGKSTAINLIEKLSRCLEPQPNIVAQKLSPEALIDALRIQETVNCKQLLREKNEGFVFSDELSTFLNRTSYEAGLASLLINFFDCKESFEYRTKGGGSQVIHHSCLGILSGSTPDWLMGAIPDTAVGGGLASRFIFVFHEAPTQPVPPRRFGKEKMELLEKLQRRLQRLAALQGEFRFTEAAQEYFDERYMQFAQNEKVELAADRMTAGYGSRRCTHLLKLAMILAASERETLTIHLDDLKAADGLLATVEKGLPLMIMLITSTEHGQAVQYVLRIIIKAGNIPRREILRRVSHRLSSRELDSVLETLNNSGMTKWVMEGREIIYEYAGGKE